MATEVPTTEKKTRGRRPEWLADTDLSEWPQDFLQMLPTERERRKQVLRNS